MTLGNRTFLEVASTLVTWWIVAFFAHCLLICITCLIHHTQTPPTHAHLINGTIMPDIYFANNFIYIMLILFILYVIWMHMVKVNLELISDYCFCLFYIALSISHTKATKHMLGLSMDYHFDHICFAAR